MAVSVFGSVLPEAISPCATCPFLKGNDKALAKLSLDMNHPNAPYEKLSRVLRPVAWVVVHLFPKWAANVIRKAARELATNTDFFVCHSSIYKFAGKQTTVTPQAEWRKCKGAQLQEAP